MKFAHMADCHIGSWRDPLLKDLSSHAFAQAVGICIKRKVDFILISGDLFNSSLPGIDNLKTVVENLKHLKDSGIPVYMVAGSHDFSPSGKTMLDVLESAGLCIGVVKGNISEGKLQLDFAQDKTGAKITGMLGKKGMLEKKYYEDLDRKKLEAEKGFKIFMFHTALTELKSKELEQMESSPLSLLPKGFDYYAGGHVHEIIDKKIEGYGRIIYPGPLFPNSFREIEALKKGGFVIYDEGKIEHVPIETHKVHSIDLKIDTKEDFILAMHSEIDENDFTDKIVTIRLRGTLLSGRVSEINFKDIFEKLYEKGAYFVMKNTSGLTAQGFEEVKIHEDSVEDIEKALIDEHLGQIKDLGLMPKEEKDLTINLISALDKIKDEGERNSDFEDRVHRDMDEIIKTFLHSKPGRQ